MKDELIKEVYQQAKENKWAYPQLFEALRDIGVERYEVDVLKYEIKYVGGGTSITHGAPTEFRPLEPGEFNPEAFKVALTKAQKQQVSYEQFLIDIAAAGIIFYRVDMKPRAVTYHGKDKRKKIVEPVPAVS